MRDQHYEAYRVAGEVFGRLYESLGFGELVMFTRASEREVSPRFMSFQWTFNAKGERCCCDENVDMIELSHLRSVEAFTTHLCGKWKNQLRKTTASPESV